MLQCAQLAYINDEENNVILASLFHDIGHLLSFEDSSIETDYFGAKDHEKIGANYLRKKGIDEDICSLIEKHVMAKKFLARDQNYFNKLSYASQQTLIQQGGIMSDNEAVSFTEDPQFETSIRIRKYDEMAKEKNKETNGLDFFYR